jgi:hypothetical protein
MKGESHRFGAFFVAINPRASLRERNLPALASLSISHSPLLFKEAGDGLSFS